MTFWKRYKHISIPINRSTCILNQTYQQPGAIALSFPSLSLNRRIKKYPQPMQ
ncbi:hypothetical protein QUA45_03265 [Microcoleus sp. Pol12A5]